MPTARLNLRANVVNGKIYLIGGIPIPDTGRTINEVYDPASDTWTTKAPIPTGVDSYASAVVGGKIFVIKSGLTQIYDAESDNWSTGAAPPLNSFLPSSATVTPTNSPTRLYLFGANTEGIYWMLTNQGFTTQSLRSDRWQLDSRTPRNRPVASAAISPVRVASAPACVGADGKARWAVGVIMQKDQFPAVALSFNLPVRGCLPRTGTAASHRTQKGDRVA